MAEMAVIYVVTWRYGDGSGSGAVAAFTAKANAERLVGILDQQDSMRSFKIEAVPFDGYGVSSASQTCPGIPASSALDSGATTVNAKGTPASSEPDEQTSSGESR